MSQTAIHERLTTPAAPPKMTYDEFLEWADEDTHAEWVDGEVVFMSPVSNLHQDIGLFLLNCISFYVQEQGSGAVRYESFQMKSGPQLPGREPDILFISNERMANLQNSYLAGPADLVVEIVSPESIRRDTVDKFEEYQYAGVSEYWLVNPLQQSVIFYRRGEDGLYDPVNPDESGTYFCGVLEGFWLKVDWLWQSPLPTLRTVLQEWGVL